MACYDGEERIGESVNYGAAFATLGAAGPMWTRGEAMIVRVLHKPDGGMRRWPCTAANLSRSFSSRSKAVSLPSSLGGCSETLVGARISTGRDRTSMGLASLRRCRISHRRPRTKPTRSAVTSPIANSMILVPALQAAVSHRSIKDPLRGAAKVDHLGLKGSGPNARRRMASRPRSLRLVTPKTEWNFNRDVMFDTGQRE